MNGKGTHGNIHRNGEVITVTRPDVWSHGHEKWDWVDYGAALLAANHLMSHPQDMLIGLDRAFEGYKQTGISGHYEWIEILLHKEISEIIDLLISRD